MTHNGTQRISVNAAFAMQLADDLTTMTSKVSGAKFDHHDNYSDVVVQVNAGAPATVSVSIHEYGSCIYASFASDLGPSFMAHFDGPAPLCYNQAVSSMAQAIKVFARNVAVNA